MSLNLPPMQKATLANGLKVVLAERHTAPVVNFSLLVESGYSADPADATGHRQLRAAHAGRRHSDPRFAEDR